MDIQILHPTQRLRLPTVCQLYGIKRTKLYLEVKEGRIPKPHKDGRMSYWLAEEILQNLAA